MATENDYKRLALDTLAALAGYEVALLSPPAPQQSALKIYKGGDTPEEPLGIWITDPRATGDVYILDTFTPAAEQWEDMGGMPFSRGYHTCEVIGDKMYLVCGQRNGSGVRDIDIYDFTTGAWTRSSLGTQYMTRNQSVNDGEKIYVLHGNNTLYMRWQRYDPATDTWMNLITATEANNDYRAVYYDGGIHLTGGDNTAAPHTLFDIATQTLRSLGTIPEVRYQHACGVVGENMVIALGRNKEGYITSCRRYDFSTGIWTAGSSLGYSKNHCRTAVVGNKLYAAGILRDTAVTDTSVYDFLTDSWADAPHSGTENNAYFGFTAHGTDLWLSGGLNFVTGAEGSHLRRLRTVKVSDFAAGDVIITCRPAVGTASIAERCTIPFAGAFVMQGGSPVPAEYSLGDGENWSVN